MKLLFTLLIFAVIGGFGCLVWIEPAALLTVPLGLIKFTVAALVLNIVLRMMDKINEINFKKFANSNDDVAKAIYFSVRLLTFGLLAIACLA